MPLGGLLRPSPNFTAANVRERLGVCFRHSVFPLEATRAHMPRSEIQVSYHVLIARDGTRARLVADEHIAWHAKVSVFQGRVPLQPLPPWRLVRGRLPRRPDHRRTARQYPRLAHLAMGAPRLDIHMDNRSPPNRTRSQGRPLPARVNTSDHRHPRKISSHLKPPRLTL